MKHRIIGTERIKCQIMMPELSVLFPTDPIVHQKAVPMSILMYWMKIIQIIAMSSVVKMSLGYKK